MCGSSAVLADKSTVRIADWTPQADDRLMTTPDRSEAARAIMNEEFGRFGLKSYP
jgi:uncharacterized protein with GYD domain